MPLQVLRRVWRPLGIAAIFAGVTGFVPRALPAQRPSDPVEAIASAGKNREEANCAQFYVQWTVTEHVDAAALQIGKAPESRQPSQQLIMERTESLTFRGDEWRFDSDGQQLFRKDAKTTFEVRREKRTVCHTKGWRYQKYIKQDDPVGPGKGQVSQTHVPGPGTYIDDIAILPVTLFARPSKTGLYQRLLQGEFAVLNDPQAASSHLTLMDKERGTTTLEFDRKRDFAPVRLQLPNRVEVQVLYGNFEGFGIAPKSWTTTRFLKNGRVGRVWSARVVSWQNDTSHIERMLPFKFPPGTEVIDLDAGLPMKAAPSGQLEPVGPHNLSRGTSPTSRLGILLYVNVFAVLVILVAYFLRRRISWRRRLPNGRES